LAIQLSEFSGEVMKNQILKQPKYEKDNSEFKNSLPKRLDRFKQHLKKFICWFVLRPSVVRWALVKVPELIEKMEDIFIIIRDYFS
jgi:hypothetical protein